MFAKPSVGKVLEVIVKKNGRPPLYSEEDVMLGIEAVERAGGRPGGDNVKKAMCDQLGLSGGINAQSLGREVERLLEERENRRNAYLVAGLSERSKNVAVEIGHSVIQDVTLHFAREFDLLRRNADERVKEKDDDLTPQRKEIRSLQKCIEEKDAVVADLEHRNADLVDNLAKATEEISALREKLSARKTDDDLEALVASAVVRALDKGGARKGNARPELVPGSPSSATLPKQFQGWQVPNVASLNAHL